MQSKTKIGARAAPAGLIPVVAVALAVSAVACGDDSMEDAPGDTTSSSGQGGNTTGPTTSSGMGGEGGTGPVTIAPVAEAATPFDAAPNPDGSIIYFTADDPDGAGVFQVPAAGGTVSSVAIGAPLVLPLGIATSTDGIELFIADPGADEGDDGGAIFTVANDGGTITAIGGSEGLEPHGLEVREEEGADQIYFTGKNAAGEGAVFKLPASGGTATEIAAGSPLADPSGIAVATNGDVYVLDTIGSGANTGRVVRIQGGTPQVFVDNLRVGVPAGIALTLNNDQVWVSGLDGPSLTDRILLIDTDTAEFTAFAGDSDVDLATFDEGAGLHRAKNADVFGFVDSLAGNGGTVFVLSR